MAEYEISFDDLGSPGVINDIPAYELPPEAWSYGHNMRYVDNMPQRLSGRTQTFGTPGVAPHFVLPVSTTSQIYWLYTSLTKAYVYDGIVHTDITRAAGGNYTATNTRDWNGNVFNGIPILNNGNDAPQYWASYSTATKLAPLTNWPAGYTARIIRSFGPQLVAFNITKGGIIYPHDVLWSHSADPGTLPNSWDITDATKDTGETSLPDVNSGIIVDAAMLRGVMYIAKENSVWRMRSIGGRFLFAFDVYLETVGIIAPRCITTVGILGQQVIWAQDDIVLHNGASQQSIISKKMRRTLFAEIDTANYLNCFSFDNPMTQEVWFCYPTSGNTQPNKALIGNYSQGNWNFSTADVDFRNAVNGIIPSSDSVTWEDLTDTWEDDTALWDTSERRKMVVCGTNATKFKVLDTGLTNDGSPYTSTLQRTGLGVIGKKRDGTLIVEFKKFKTFKRVWLKIEGGPVSVRIGTQTIVGGTITWQTPVTFNPATDLYVDTILSGRCMAIEISSTVSQAWQLMGYKVELNVNGNF